VVEDIRSMEEIKDKAWFVACVFFAAITLPFFIYRLYLDETRWDNERRWDNEKR
jgi:hypothetical protein